MALGGRSPDASMDASLVELTRRLAAGDPTARAELARQPGDMARALDEIVTVMERRTALLAETEQYFDALVQQSLMGVYVAARDRFLYANQALSTIVGYTVEEIVGGVELIQVVHPEDWPTVSRNLERRFRGETFRASCRLLRKDGGIVLVEADGRRVLRKGEPVIIGAVMVVDTLKRGRTEARRQRQALFRSERMAALGELLGGSPTSWTAPSRERSPRRGSSGRWRVPGRSRIRRSGWPKRRSVPDKSSGGSPRSPVITRASGKR